MSRNEQEIFDELAVLCASPRYVHALAHLASATGVVGYWEEMTPEDLGGWFKPDRLIRTEISTLIGLMVKARVDLGLPGRATLEMYLNRSDALLAELHRAMEGTDKFARWKELVDRGENPFAQGNVLREAIFYAGDSAYSFQYRDFAPKKYGRDNAWLQGTKGFSIDEAR